MKNRLKLLLRKIWHHTKIIILSCVWLIALLFAIYPELVAELIYPIGMVILSFFDNGIKTEKEEGISSVFVWCKLYIERKSFFFIPIAVVVDTFMIWLLIKNSEFKQWLPTLLIEKRPLNTIFIIVIFSSIGLIIGIFTGLDALSNISSIDKEPANYVDKFYQAAIISLSLILFFTIVAKYCSLIMVDVSPSGAEIVKVKVDQYLDQTRSENNR